MKRLHRPPTALWLVGGVALAFLGLPLVALVTRVDWPHLWGLMRQPATAQTLVLSVGTAAAATVLCVLLGAPLALLMARCGPRTRQVLRAFVTLPLVAPPVVGGVALLAAYGRRGLVGGWLYDTFGWSLPFTTSAVVAAQAFVALPFLVLALEGALRGIDPELEEAAAVMGAGRWYTFTRITLPLAAPGLVSGVALAFARALGEFGATITFAGSLQGVTRTAPLAVYLALEREPAAAYGLSVLLLAVAVTVLVCLRDSWLGVRSRGRVSGAGSGEGR